MKKYDIKTWCCETCNYSWSGTRPSIQMIRKATGSVVQHDDDCPNGCGRTLLRATDPDKKAKHSEPELDDIVTGEADALLAFDDENSEALTDPSLIMEREAAKDKIKLEHKDKLKEFKSKAFKDKLVKLRQDFECDL